MSVYAIKRAFCTRAVVRLAIKTNWQRYWRSLMTAAFWTCNLPVFVECQIELGCASRQTSKAVSAASMGVLQLRIVGALWYKIPQESVDSAACDTTSAHPCLASITRPTSILYSTPRHFRSTNGIAEFAGLEFAGLENDGLKITE